MKKLVAAALLATVATTAPAAVTISFTGTTTASPQNSDAGTQTVSGTITIDTALLPANGDTLPNTNYASGTSAGGAPFMTYSFSSTGTAPVISAGDAAIDTSAYNDASPAPFSLGGNYTISTQSAINDLVTTFQISTDQSTPSATFGGAPLPDLRGLANLLFNLDTTTGEGDPVYHIEGTIDSITYLDTSAGAVPEPASWALMIGGFGLVGASLRRRRATVAFA